ncbi:MAG TPA: 5-oxoprolinase subunit PxpA [Cyclobacteriaceae bacterium]
MTIDLNCDMGEGMQHDAELMQYISSANIACGYHAGDEATMQKTVELCLKNNVAIGAHPGFDDKKNFGRTSMQLSDEDLYSLIQVQLKILNNICEKSKTRLHHVKPHGALYNMAAKDQGMSKVIAQSVKDFDASLVFYGLSNSFMISEAKSIGLKTANEVFADRSYQSDGSLTPRTEPNALITDTIKCLDQIRRMVKEGAVTSVDQKQISIQPQTICIHGDGDHAVEFAKAIHSMLLKESITIQPIS